MNNYPFGSNSPKSFNAYPRGDFDIESGTIKRIKRSRNSSFYPFRMMKSLANRLHYCYKLHPFLVFFVSLAFGVTILIVLSLYEHHYRMMRNYAKLDDGFDNYYPYAKLKNLVMVAGHSVYTSSNCGKVDKEDSWFLESYQKHPGQAATFLSHIKEGVENAARDDAALLLFSGGETRKDAGPRSEAQSYWTVAESKGWFSIFTYAVNFSGYMMYLHALDKLKGLHCVEFFIFPFIVYICSSYAISSFSIS